MFKYVHFGYYETEMRVNPQKHFVPASSPENAEYDEMTFSSCYGGITVSGYIMKNLLFI
jgi:hypothetical protein